MVDYVRKMNAKLSCKYGQHVQVEQLLFLFCKCFLLSFVRFHQSLQKTCKNIILAKFKI